MFRISNPLPLLTLPYRELALQTKLFPPSWPVFQSWFGFQLPVLVTQLGISNFCSIATLLSSPSSNLVSWFLFTFSLSSKLYRFICISFALSCRLQFLDFISKWFAALFLHLIGPCILFLDFLCTMCITQ